MLKEKTEAQGEERGQKIGGGLHVKPSAHAGERNACSSGHQHLRAYSCAQLLRQKSQSRGETRKSKGKTRDLMNLANL